ncbi:MAG: DUF2157 domain-containing protein [Bacteroidales bacterium]|jgi:uncharacterized membrane protein|nr:DUF2157 domain-containing protein [Bacteroidales bacterium]
MSLIKDIPELVNANVITQETADRITNYYRDKKVSPTNKLFVVFGILGAILIGLGIILIIAHNWDQLSRTSKTIIGFAPLIIAQVICGYVLIKKRSSTAWRESSSAFLFFAIGACISIISQTYNIPGNLSSFLLTWALLAIPMVYIMNSSVTSLLYLIAITFYAGETGYWSYPVTESYTYWLLLLGIIPHYYIMYKQKPKSNFMIIHNWLIPLSVIITLGTVANNQDEFMYIAYITLFGLLYLIGSKEFFANQKIINNGYKILGSVGTIALLLSLSFDWFWEELYTKTFILNEVITSAEFITISITMIPAIILLYTHIKKISISNIQPIALVFVLFIITFFIGLYSSLAVILINLYIFAIGILTIREGANRDHLGILNYGLMIITALTICRFFDTDLSFAIRGVLFVLVGVGFFIANYSILKKRRKEDSV